jgi:hypothetical protein
MKRGRSKSRPGPNANDIAFPPPYAEQSKYLVLADKFLSSDGSEAPGSETAQNVISIESGESFRRHKKKRSQQEGKHDLLAGSQGDTRVS